MNALGGYLGFNILPKAFLSCKLEIKALMIELVDNLLYVPGHRLPLRFWPLQEYPELPSGRVMQVCNNITLAVHVKII